MQFLSTHAVTLVVLLPLLGALLAGTTYLLLGRKADAHHGEHDDHGHGPVVQLNAVADAIAMFFTTGGVLAAAAISWWLFIGLNTGTVQASSADWFTWFSLGSSSVTFGYVLDKLSATMLIVVTTVSACVHLYSISYMHEDTSRRRFFIYLSFFTFAMLMLVTAPNLVQMFLGWEGVGVCSYLLIGFWHHKASANAAAIKAFIVNRVADAAMLIGLFMVISLFGSLTYAEFLPRVEEVAGTHATALNLAALLIFIGAMGKSAQFGLHTWLPDAMEGPTPVSALIHAATMVTAGVFLLCRLSPMFEFTPDVLTIVGWVGALTAIFAATVGLTQTDIKRVIAYSTCSQLGYMFFAIGVSAYPAAMFHLTTHAFFKALLFLGAGSVIHAMHHEQNIFKMGGLRKALPFTYGAMWLGSLALAGIPPFAGFFSKDLILESAFMAPGSQGQYLYVLGTVGAIMTAIYGFRIVFMAFDGKLMGDKKTASHAHENWGLLLPMLPLAVGAVVAGYLLHHMGELAWWQGSIFIAEHNTGLEHAHHIHPFFKWLPLALIVPAIVLAWKLFVKRRDIPKQLAETWDFPYAISFNKWYVDELYDFLWVHPTKVLATFSYKVIDRRIIDGTVNGVADTLAGFGSWLRQYQTGYVYHYALAMVLGLVAVLAVLAVRG